MPQKKEEKSLKFTEQNKVNIASILSPLQEKIMHFEKKVDDTHKQSIDYHAALREQIRGLSDINAQMSKETINLTKALKGDSKVQLGSKVSLKSSDGKTKEFQVVGTVEADPLQGKISDESPIGKALLGQKVDEEVEIKTPIETITYKIVDIS